MPTPDVYDKFRGSPRYAAFSALCRELKQVAQLGNLVTAEAATKAVLEQIKDLIRPMKSAERVEAAQWLWGTHLDVPPFDRVFPLLSPSGRPRARRAPAPKG